MTPDYERDGVSEGFCKCGCGQKTKISTYTRKTKSRFKGNPLTLEAHLSQSYGKEKGII